MCGMVPRMYCIFFVCHKHKSLLLVPIQPTSSTKELHDTTLIFFMLKTFRGWTHLSETAFTTLTFFWSFSFAALPAFFLSDIFKRKSFNKKKISLGQRPTGHWNIPLPRIVYLCRLLLRRHNFMWSIFFMIIVEFWYVCKYFCTISRMV